MISQKFLLMIAGIAVLSGCATPLRLETSGPDAARIIGVPQSQVLFVGYCDFAEVPRSGDRTGGGRGSIVLTDQAIFLLSGDLPRAVVSHKIPYQQIGGVDVRHFGRARQLQILRSNSVVVMEITKNKAMVDQEGSETARTILRDHGVADWKSEKYYMPKQKIPIIIPIPI